MAKPTDEGFAIYDRRIARAAQLLIRQHHVKPEWSAATLLTREKGRDHGEPYGLATTCLRSAAHGCARRSLTAARGR